MNKKIILVLIILLLSNTTFVWAAPHCYRQDISRVNNNYSQSNVGFVGEFSTGTTYDYIVQPGTKYVFGGIQPSVWECGNGFESSQ